MGPLKIIKLQNLHETLTKGPMSDILKNKSHRRSPNLFIGQNAANWSMSSKSAKIPHSINTEKRIFPIKKVAHTFEMGPGAKIV